MSGRKEFCARGERTGRLKGMVWIDLSLTHLHTHTHTHTRTQCLSFTYPNIVYISLSLLMLSLSVMVLVSLKIFFLMWTFFKDFIEFVNLLWYCFCFTFWGFWGFFWSRGMWDFSSPTRDQTHTPCIGRHRLNPQDHQGSPSVMVL